MPATKSKCPHCGKEYSVTADGALRKHNRSIWLGGPNYRTEPCNGPQAPTVAAALNPCRTLVGGDDYRFVALRKAYTKLGLKWPPKKLK